MSKDRELKIIIKADGSVAVNEIKVVAQSTDELEKQLKEARLEMARLEGEFDKVVGKTKSADTEINKLKIDSAALKNENRQLSAELQKVQSALTEATTRVRGLESQLTSATKDVKTFESSWSDLATGVNQALDILGKVKGYAEQGWNLAEQGTQLRAAKDSFDSYAKSVGKSSDEILAKLKQASGGTISDMNLVKTASLAMSLGVTQDASKMANLLEVARNKARLFGIGTQQAFEDIVTGIGRASPKILDNLGIRIPAAFEEMTDGMSDAGKVAKLFELTLEEGNKQLAEMGGMIDTKADSMQRLSASYDNLKASAGEFVFDALQPELEWLTKTVRATDDFITANGGLNSSFSDLIDTVELVGGTFAAWEIAVIVSKVADLAMKTEWLTKAQLALNVAMNANPYVLLATGLTTLGIYLKQVQDETKDWQKYTEEQLKTLEKMGPTGKELSLQLQISFKEAEVAAIGSIDEIDRRLDEIARKAQERQKRDEQFVYRQYVQGRDDPGTFNDLVRQQDNREISQLTSQKAKIQQVNNEILSLKDKLNAVFDEDDFGADVVFDGLDKFDDVFEDLLGQFEETERKSKKAGDGIAEFKRELNDIASYAINDMELAEGFFSGTVDDIDKMVDSLDELADAQEEVLKVWEKYDEINENVFAVMKGGGYNYAKDLRSLTPDKAVTGMLSFATGGIWNAGEDQKFDKVKKDLSQTIAEAVSSGFANVDFSNLELTLGNVLSSVSTKVVAQKNPVIDAAGAISWGNLGINLAASAVSNVLTRSGRFFGGREEHGKEAIQQAADLQSRISQAYVDSFTTEITSIYATGAMKDAIERARNSFFKVSTGYTWSDSGDGIFADRTRTYAMIDNGASAALQTLTEAMKSAETYSENQEAWINLQAAKGFEYGALQAKVSAYEESLQKVYFGSRQFAWTDGKTGADINVTKLTREVEATLAEMQRELARATAERVNNAAAGFARYAPWLENIYMPNQYSQQSSTGNGIFSPVVRGTPMPGDTGYMASVDGLSRDAYYDAFESLQNNLADRNIASGLLDMVKEAGSSMYELEALKITDSDAYAEKYLTYVERRVSAYEEVLERMDAIFSDETKSYEERIAALENYERTYAEYSQAKLDKLRLEKAQEEEEKRMMADERQAKIEGLLSWVGEVDQQGKKVVIIHGNDTTAAIEELMAEHADDPQLLTILKDMLEKTQSKARWG